MIGVHVIGIVLDTFIQVTVEWAFFWLWEELILGSDKSVQVYMYFCLCLTAQLLAKMTKC